MGQLKEYEVRLSVPVHRSTADRLAEVARKRGTSTASICRLALYEYLQRQPGGRVAPLPLTEVLAGGEEES